MPGFLYTTPAQAKCREHGVIGPISEHLTAERLINDHANKFHPWWFDPDDEDFGGPAFVAQRRVRCEDHPTLVLTEPFGRYEEAATAARKHNREQHAEVAAAPSA